MSFIANFFEYSLNAEQIRNISVIFCVILIIVGFAARIFFPEPKKQAWIISMVNSFVCLNISAAYLIVKVPSREGFFWFGENGKEIFLGIDNVSFLTCLWFALANIFDLIFGVCFYRSQVGFLTGYFHHSIYIWMMVVSTTGDGYILQHEKFASAFAFLFIEEIPTLLLALGSVFPALRSDLGFGITFFLSRIVYHGYMMVYSYVSNCGLLIYCLFGLTFIMHLNWFYGWVSKYGSKLGSKKGKGKKKL
jgi:hypothetical protein